MTLLLILSSIALIPSPATSLNSSLVLEEVRSVLKHVEETPDNIFELELTLANMEGKDQELLHDAAELAKSIRGQLIEFQFPPTIYNDLFDLELKLSKLDDQDDLPDTEPCGVWYLGMNLNPDDGHVMGYDVGWADDDDIGDEENALLMDYLNQTVWNMPAKYIAIVRHQRGLIDAVKVFVFQNWEQSLSQKFKDMNPGRKIVTVGGPKFSYTAPGVENLVDDPVFGVGGDLAFNWRYANNGNRVVLTGGHLSAEGANDDNTHGLGNHFALDSNSIGGTTWRHEISNIQDCPLASCSSVRIQGTDHGIGTSLKSGPVYGNYAIYISANSKTFPLEELLKSEITNNCIV